MRIVALIFVLLTFLFAVWSAFLRISLLSSASDASAVQVTQIHSEAQTSLLFGILSVVVVIAIGVLFPKQQTPPATSRADSTPHPPAQDSPAPPDTSLTN